MKLAPNSSDSPPSAVRSGYKEDDDDDDDDMYADLPTSELVPRTLAAMKAITDQGISTKPKEKSPLEESILEQSNMPRGMIQSMSSMAQNQAEEMAAVFDLFVASLVDIAPMPVDRYYAVALMGGEMAGLDNSERKRLLTTRNGVERMRFVLQKLEEKIGMTQAKRILYFVSLLRFITHLIMCRNECWSRFSVITTHHSAEPPKNTLPLITHQQSRTVFNDLFYVKPCDSFLIRSL